MQPIRVLVVDDSLVVRSLIGRALKREPDIEVAATASDGHLALAKLDRIRPDLITLDLEMPVMDGLQTLRAIRAKDPDTPVLVFSSLTRHGARATLDALELGATDYIAKPTTSDRLNDAGPSISSIVEEIGESLATRIRALCHRVEIPTRPAPPRPTSMMPPRSRRVSAATAVPRLLVIGASTGGPNALTDLLSRLIPHFPLPILIVQHMPPQFTPMLAERLDRHASLSVREAAEGDPIDSGAALVAPGNVHMGLTLDNTIARVCLFNGPEVHSCRPAVDILFQQAARAFGPGVVAVVLTGMGCDGLDGCRAVAEAGGRILVQDADSSVVWGMPGIVAEAGLADAVLSVPEIADQLNRIASSARMDRETLRSCL